ncbi:flavodoxin family protein [Caulobacter sp. RL271]|uniref:Flavodoxin family protein n=1 Tax=Caulobacter segnis TaxID=88688 RepID=A0ABY4ZSK0_9CAUL|nr:flavodoxin family protein [Caulobacter segnis]USQ95792.1 flavodoxin family protein [Caulobacter segnis]
MTTVAIPYHSGYGHTEVLAQKVAEGVRDAGQTPVLLKIENAAQDFAPLIEEITKADAVIFGAPTYMGDVSGVFKVFADATASAWFTGAWKDKLAAGFTNSHSFAGDKLHALNSLAILAAQHGMNWVSLGVPAPAVTAAERGPDSLNRVGAFLGLAAQSDNASPEITPPAGDRETARLLGERVAKAAVRWAVGASAAADLGKAA